MSSARTYITDRVVTKDDPNPVSPTVEENMKMTEQTHLEPSETTPPSPPTSTESTISAKRIAANRRNAQRSTGPKTPEGKAICAQNPLKHGLFARDLIITSRHHSESAEDYEKLVDSLYDELQPETVFQEHLVRQIANCLWRSRRAIASETADIQYKLGEIDSEVQRQIRIRRIWAPKDSPEMTQAEKKALIADEVRKSLVPDRDTSHKIVWYEMRLDRQIARAYALLNSLKSRPTPKSEEPTLGFGNER